MDKEIRSLITRAWDIKGGATLFPGPQPISVERKHLPYLKENYANYYVCEKTDGERNFLVARIEFSTFKNCGL